MKTPLTPVIFRRWKKEPHSVIALFPTLPGNDNLDTCESYEHIGQHGAADITLMMRKMTVPATLLSFDVRELGDELFKRGYRLTVRQRESRKDYLTRCKAHPSHISNKNP